MKYTIKKGHHYCIHPIAFHCGKKRLSISVIFDKNCLSAEGIAGINKLYGLSYGMHHKNSARFGWKANKGLIEIYAYYYVNGVRKSLFIKNIIAGYEYDMSISVNDDKYVFNCAGTVVAIPHGIPYKSLSCRFGYRLYPYFGGVSVAPKTMSIIIKQNK